MRTSLQGLLALGTPIIADGGMGTMLFAMGLVRGTSPELWNIEHPERVRSVHRGYIEAGAQIILSNSFGGNAFRLSPHNLHERVDDLNRAAAALARAEADAAAAPVVVGGSMGPTGKMLEPLGDLSFEAARDAFEAQARALAAGGVDVLWVETMSDLEEVRAAVEGCRAAEPELPIVATMTFDTRGRTMMGVTPERALEALSEMGVVALGGNCGNGPAEIEGVISRMQAQAPALPLIAKSNAGSPRMEGGVAVYDATPEVMADHAREVLARGARIIGACCGSTPDHIRAIAGALARR